MEKIGAFLAAEKKGNHAYDIKDWQSAMEQYGKMLQLAEADHWLSTEDPNVLFIRAHYSECLMHLGRDEEASKIHDDILSTITPPDTDEEAEVIVELLHLRVAVVNKLRARKRNDEALRAIQQAHYYSKEAFGEDDENTISLSKSYQKVMKQLLKEESVKLSRRLPRVRARRQMQQTAISNNDMTTALLPFGMDPVQQESKATLLSKSPRIQVTGPAALADGGCLPDSDTAIEDDIASDARTLSPTASYIVGGDSRRPRQRLSSMPNELPQEGLETSITREPRTVSQQLQDNKPAIQDQSAETQLMRRDTRSRSVDYGVPKLTREPTLPDRPVKPNISDAELLNAASETDYQDTDQWFSKYLRQVHDLLARFSPVKADARPKIAILDTGINTEHPEVQKIYKPKDREKKRIKGVWRPNGKKWLATEDVDGHGTHCAMVANKVAPNADLYILRVFEDRHHVSGEHVVEAITHSIEKWNVDIISMSFALNKEDRDSKRAITEKLKEVKDKVLMFAAASNSGPIEDRKYPAKRPEVFAIHAVHGRHQPYNKNPPLWSTEINIGALGMFISAPYKDTAVERLSGTSMACAVAAGIAALVLEFCRLKPLDGEVEIRDPSLLQSKEGMEQIFMQMRLNKSRINPPRHGEMLCLQPWELMSLERGGGRAEAARRLILAEIVSALEKVED